jgi:hypothetical protein
MNATKWFRLLMIFKRRNITASLIIMMSSFSYIPAKAQSDVVYSHFKVTADLVSHYVWRGSMATGSPTPSIQPSLAYTNGNLEAGFWGSTDFTGSYKEIDAYIAYTTGHTKLVLTDYDWNFNRSDFFNYKNIQTGHILEGTIGFTGTEAFPVSVTWNTMFYGFDKKPEDSTQQAFSSYIELGYSKGIASLFFGFTPWQGFYNNYGSTNFDPGARKKSFSIVNIGVSLTKAVKITDSFSLPLKATLAFNPSASYSRNDFVHLVFGITF